MAREAAFAEAEAATKCRTEVEASLKAIQDERAADVKRLQLQESDLKDREARLATRESDPRQ